ncbi:MAG: hypothetical protein EKK40_12155 [Bradyrhizobiaceae bacterium]|nr:MAG: hypothetical protein EKK40_12155 [Bradyrhizobiaceae bacterium]
MKKLVIATCAAALMSAVSLGPVLAQSTGAAGGQDAAMKSNSPMNAQNKMTKKKKMSKAKSGTTTGSAGASTNTTGGAGSMNSNK